MNLKLKLLFLPLLASHALANLVSGPDVLTQHNDNARTGLNAAETVLKPANVNAAQFGKLFSQPVDGQVYAQPLVLGGVQIPGKGTRTVVFVATQHDSVYAFDADSAAAPLWKRSFINPAAGITPVPYGDTGNADVAPEIGITSTPVIDPVAGTLYCLAKTKEKGVYFHRLHALDVTTGAERAGSPVIVTATVDGTGDGSVNGKITFHALRQHQRTSLLLLKGVVYVASASHGDVFPYHGWVLGYHATTLARVGVFNTTPNGGLGGVWQAGAGLAADASGNIYFTTGNGSFDPAQSNYGDSVVKLATDGTGALSFADYFAPSDQLLREQIDADLGSSGVLLLPPIAGTSKNLALLSGKSVNGVTTMFLLDRASLGGFHAAGDASVQSLSGQIGEGFGVAAFFNGTAYLHGSNDVLKAFTFTGAGLLPTAPTAQASADRTFSFPGATPSISANGTQDGIVWELERVASSPAVLRAYRADNVAVELYHSRQAAGGADEPGDSVKFTVPTISRGKVYVGGARELAVYGLLSGAAPPAVTIRSPAAGARLSAPTLTITGTASGKLAIDQVEVAIDAPQGDGAYRLASGTKAWKFGAYLRAGHNLVRVRATDRTGHTAVAVRTFTLVRSTPLTVNVEDNGGSVTAGFRGTSQREIDATYTIAATPRPGFAFLGWSGDSSSTNPTLTFQMKVGASYHAHFLPSPFLTPDATGSYNGISHRSGNPVASLTTLTFTGTGAFTVRTLLAGLTYSGRGFVSAAGDATATLYYGRAALPLMLHFNFAAGQFTGWVGDPGSTFTLNRATFGKANPSGLKGYYTLRIEPEPIASGVPHGPGYATLTVDDSGNVRTAGVLADGTRFAQGAFLSKARVWPLYVALYGGRGYFESEVTFSGAPAALGGSADWHKGPHAGDARFAGGFDANLPIVGALYDRARTPNALGIAVAASNVELHFSGGDLGLPSGNVKSVNATLSAGNVVAFPADPYLPAFVITPANGLIRGTFKHPVLKRTTSYNGVVVQSDRRADGLFLDPGQSGAVSLVPK